MDKNVKILVCSLVSEEWAKVTRIKVKVTGVMVNVKDCKGQGKRTWGNVTESRSILFWVAFYPIDLWEV